MIYGYIRVSTKTQNIDRQLIEMEKISIPIENLFIDYQSGKDFERDEYKRLVGKISEGDLLVIKSIDRLGRNYQMILDEWVMITKTLKADIYVIDMPILDTRGNENLVGRFMVDVVLQILSFVANHERDSIRSRQAEGIQLAKLRGVHLGRPLRELPDNFYEVVLKYKKHQITNIEATKLLGLSKGTFFRMIRDNRNEIEKRLIDTNIPSDL